jgi:hypothetical protein
MRMPQPMRCAGDVIVSPADCALIGSGVSARLEF